ncbi:MAG TPA: S46 family peptidase [Bacteroidales bacterium]|nr:MAG: Peptidase S46 [Bacteroidetes bacterium ADurb.Bin217]HPM13173.1 S46 family peptidase [Bacteroidales bacterium]
MKRLISICLLIITITSVKADEGMWLLTMLEKLDLQKKGCALTPEQIYSINKSSLKDAIIGLGEGDNPYNFFCTAELVSSQGLAFTNYHCGFDMIQKHTNLANNYIDNGFWAKNKQEELTNDGITATIVVRMIDVSDKIMPLFSLGITKKEALEDTISKISSLIEKSVSDTSHYKGSVQGFFENNQYFLFIYETYQDVRLVGAPPRSIGKFGGDTDNWMWPRHTGDFCVLRIYSDKSNRPNTYSQENIPLRPRHFLPISLTGYSNGDYAMVMGFPGSTDRYKTASGVEGLQTFNNTAIISIGDTMLSVYKSFMNSSPAIKIKYAAKYDQMSNYWKYAIGQNKGIVALAVVNQKLEQEKELQAWIEADADRKQKYGTILNDIKKFYSTSNIAKYASNYMNVGLLNAPEIFMFTYECLSFLDAISTGDPVQIKIESNALREKIKEHFKSYDITVDKAQFVAMSELYKNRVPDGFHPGYFSIVQKKYKGNFSKYADQLYAKSIFADEQKMNAFLEKPSSKAFLSDPAFELLRNTFPAYFQIQAYLDSYEFDRANQLYVEALMKYKPDSLFYPDANSTLRLTYGYVGDYKPRDAVHYSHYTTLAGIMEKEDAKNEEFEVSPKLKDLYTSKDYGIYADNHGELPVCFITNNDITGGNSGSPVMNAKGELIGIAFDGNWEAMSGDIIYEPNYQKCIAVDIRYVLFVIDKFAGAGYLLEEMKIVK